MARRPMRSVRQNAALRETIEAKDHRIELMTQELKEEKVKVNSLQFALEILKENEEILENQLKDSIKKTRVLEAHVERAHREWNRLSVRLLDAEERSYNLEKKLGEQEEYEQKLREDGYKIYGEKLELQQNYEALAAEHARCGV